ncbi:S-protein homolog 5 [Brassica napus]|nr:PREDICTED: uncharacterized protein LOC106310953 [Brassica oleracea var. oleracea]XP_048621963.1 S-protein homolog 5 [Brassica napus]
MLSHPKLLQFNSSIAILLRNPASMRNSPKLCVAFLIMVLLFGPSHGLPPFWPRTDLTMTNNLGGPVLTVHCKSKDNDLGVHMVAAKTDYHFSFQPNIWKTTLFFCSFQWNNQVKRFDIFDAPRDQDDGYKFNWTIKPDGPCKLGKKVKCFPWK